MRKLKRLAALGLATGIAALGFGLFAGTPAVAQSSPAENSVREVRVLPSWHYRGTYFSLEQCQSVGQGYVDDPDTPFTDYYCDQIYQAPYVMWRLYVWWP